MVPVGCLLSYSMTSGFTGLRSNISLHEPMLNFLFANRDCECDLKHKDSEVQTLTTFVLDLSQWVF